MDDDVVRQMGTVYDEDPPVVLEHFRISSALEAFPFLKEIFDDLARGKESVYEFRLSPEDSAAGWATRLGAYPDT